MSDGILAVDFLPRDVDDLRFDARGGSIPNLKGARLTIRWDGKERKILVSRERGHQATRELLVEEAA